MAEAVRLKTLVPGHASMLAAKQARKAQLDAIGTKPFSSLSAADKDVLLEEIAIRMGLIQKSGG